MNSCVSRPTSIFFRPTKTPMPLSTWTMRSPTFRSRKSERNVRVADRRFSWVCRSSSKTSVSAVDWRGGHLVIGQHLDHAFGASLRMGDEHDGLARLPRGA